MKLLLHLRVITPSSVLLDVRGAVRVQMQLADGGGIGILPGHGPLLAETVVGDIVFVDEFGEHAQRVGAGIMSIRDNEISVLTVDSTAAAQPSGGVGMSPGQAGQETARFQRLTKALYFDLGAGRDQGQRGQEQD